MTQQRIEIVIVDDHIGVRKGIKNLLSREATMSVVGEAGTGKEALAIIEEKSPDLVLLDVELPDLRGYEVARRLQEFQPGIKLLGVSSYTDQHYIQSMMENGAAGYLTKDEAPELLIYAIRNVMQGEVPWISPKASRHSDKVRVEAQTLTEREQRILSALLNGKKKKEIALDLKMDERRLNRYLQFLMEKFDAETEQELREAAAVILRV